MSFPDGQPRPDENPSNQEFPQVPDQPEPQLPTDSDQVAKPTMGYQPYGAAAESTPTEPQGQAYAAPYAAPYGAGPFAAPQEDTPQAQPYGAPAEAAPATPYGTPVDPYATPATPYATPASPYATPAHSYDATSSQAQTQSQPYASPYSQPDTQTYGATSGQEYGAPQPPYDAPQSQAPYGTPQAAPYGAPQTQPQAAPYGAPYGATPTTAAKPMSVLGIIALVVSILAFLISAIPFVNFATYLLAIPALIMGIIAIAKSGPQGATRGRGLGIGAVIVSILALIFAISTQFLYSTIFDRVNAEIQNNPALKELQNPDAPLPDGDILPDSDIPLPSIDEPDSTVGGAESAIFEGEGLIADGNYYVKFLSASKSVADYQGKPTVVLSYELTNKRTDGEYSFFDTNVTASQNGRDLELAVYSSDLPEGYDPISLLQEIKPGDTKKITLGFVLVDDKAPVNFEAEGLFTEGKVIKEFPLQ